MECQGFSVEFERLPVVAEAGFGVGDASQREARLTVLGTQLALPYLMRCAKCITSFLKHAQIEIRGSHGPQGVGDVRVIGTQHGLANGQ